MKITGNIQASVLASAVESAPETESERFNRIMDRRYRRIFQWASAREKDDIVDVLAYLILLTQARRKNARVSNGARDDALREAITKLKANHSARIKGAEAMLANSPKQAAKVKARGLWEDWQAGRALHKSGAAFARHVVEVCTDLESTVTVERWAREWAGEKKQASG